MMYKSHNKSYVKSACLSWHRLIKTVHVRKFVPCFRTSLSLASVGHKRYQSPSSFFGLLGEGFVHCVGLRATPSAWEQLVRTLVPRPKKL